MNGQTLIEFFRSEVRDEVEPYLWPDDEVYSYATQAQDMFCRLTGGVADATSALTTVTVPAGVEFSAISPRILKLRAAYNAATGRDIELLNYEDLQFNTGCLFGQRFNSTPGPVSGLITGMEPNKVRWVSIPSEDLVVRLLIYRMPLADVTANANLELDEHHQHYLLSWMKHLAHKKQDAETFDKGRSDLFRDEFLEYCRQAKAERERREHKFRTVAYGGY